MRCQHVLTLVTGFIECICFAGVTFGWASLVFVLKNEKYFQDLCQDIRNQTDNSTADCSAQDEQFSIIFTVAAFANTFMALPCGYIFDRLGTALTRFIAILLYTTATLLIALSKPDTAVLLFPALSFLATGGILFLMTNMQVGNLFGSQRSTIITFYNGAFDSSSVIFLVVKVLYQNGISLQTVFLFISSCSICHILRTIFLMPRTHIPFPVPEGFSYGLKCEKHDPKRANLKHSLAPSNDEEKDKKDDVTDHSLNSIIKHVSPLMSASSGSHLPASDRWTEDPNLQEATSKVTTHLDKKHTEVSFRSCVFSSLFIWHLVWLSLMQLRHYLFIGTLNPTITHLSGGDLDKVSTYTNVFAVSQFFGVVCAPWNGLLMDRHKKKQKDSDKLDDLRSSILSLSMTAVQCMLFSMCASIPMLPALYPTFILQVINRSFLYGGNAAFLSVVFPPQYFGKLFGLASAFSAVISLLQYPAFYIIRIYLDGDPFYVNIFLLILMLLAFVHPINVFRICRQEKNARKAPEGQCEL
ncbi:equilibrative nucleobase transporter 1 [Pseudophryne corroboree]|uniref:equilibrative nucleobase transporter 1 n=1 Tax=Pseudophryne corroboree TaxID=495146 RepID=UPI00308152BD